MKEKVCFNVFILCVIFSKGILANFLEDEIEKSSNLLVREKRVINKMPGGDVLVGHGAAPYVVNIRKNGFVHCVGTILSHHTVITAARCVVLELSEYSIFSGSVNARFGQLHMITQKKLHGHSPSRSATFMTGIALLTVNPPFEFSSTTNKLELHTEPVFAGMHAIINGWGGKNSGRPNDSGHSCDLRSIIVPIMNHRDCVNAYRGVFEIKEEDICTYHYKQRCGYSDAGAALVIDNKLVGVHIGEVETAGRALNMKPDIFVLLQDLNYRRWIRENIV